MPPSSFLGSIYSFSQACSFTPFAPNLTAPAALTNVQSPGSVSSHLRAWGLCSSPSSSLLLKYLWVPWRQRACLIHLCFLPHSPYRAQHVELTSFADWKLKAMVGICLRGMIPGCDRALYDRKHTQEHLKWKQKPVREDREHSPSFQSL